VWDWEIHLDIVIVSDNNDSERHGQNLFAILITACGWKDRKPI
jgi:hypothetical protein